MLTRQHIEWYIDDILRAYRVGMEAIIDAERVALYQCCSGCMFCTVRERHREILQTTYMLLLKEAGSLQEGEKSNRSFPKKMFTDTTLYRGFITDTGEYVDMFRTNHAEFRQRYTTEHGIERAHKMIKVHERYMRAGRAYRSGMMTQVEFLDRKYIPNQLQFETIRNLMIDAEGALSFGFAYDTNHPAT